MIYENKDLNDIKEDVSNEFEKNDTNFVRDDKEIYQAGLAVAGKYRDDLNHLEPEIEEMAALGAQGESMSRKRESLKEGLNDNITRLEEAGYGFFTENSLIIEEVAGSIESTENDVLELLINYRDLKNEQQKIEELVEMNQTDYMTPNPDGSFELTTATNEPKIHDVLGDLVRSGETWKIDYSACTNPSIKQRMIEGIGGDSCYVTVGEGHEGNTTYVLQNGANKESTKLPIRALIWEGVELTPPGVLAKQSKIDNDLITQKRKDQLRSNSKAGESLDAMLEQAHWRKIVDMIPKGLKQQLEEARANGREQIYIDFLSKSESKLNDVVLYAKQGGFQLAGEPISKSTFSWGGLMEVHLISGDEQRTVPFLDERDDNLGRRLSNIIDREETDYNAFLTQRIKQKRSDFSMEDKKTNILASVEKGEIASEKVIKDAKYGLGLFDKMVDNLRMTESGAFTDAEDYALADLKQYTQDALYSLDQKGVTTTGIDTIKEELFKKYKKVRDFDLTTRSKPLGVGTVEVSASPELIKTYINNLFNGADQELTYTSIRALGGDMQAFGNESSFVINEENVYDGVEIGEKNDQGEFEKNEEYDTMYQNISLKLDPSIPGNEKLLKELSDAADIGDQKTGRDTVLSILQNPNYNILPTKRRKTDLGTSDQRHIAKEIWKGMRDNKKAIEKNNEATSDSVWLGMQEEMNDLLAKSDKTEADISRIQVIHYLSENKNARNTVLDGTLASLVGESMFLGTIQGTVRGLATPLLINHGGGSSSDIMNDIVGAGRDISDKTGKMIDSMAPAILTEIVIMIAASVMVASGVGAAGGLALMSQRLVSLGMKSKQIRTVVASMRHMQRSAKYQKLQGALRAASTKADDGIRYAKSKIPKKKVTNTKPTSSSPATKKTLTQQAKAAADLGGTHTVLQNTVTGDLDKSFNERAIDFFQRFGMYGIMGRLNQSMQIGRLSKLTDSGRNISSFLLEEGLMMPMDQIINLSFANKNLTMQEIGTNLAMGFLFSFIPGVRDVIAGNKKRDINGKNYGADQIENMLEENGHRIQNKIAALRGTPPGNAADSPKQLQERLANLQQRSAIEPDPKTKEIVDEAAKNLEARLNAGDANGGSSSAVAPKTKIESSSKVDDQSRDLVQGNYVTELLDGVDAVKNRISKTKRKFLPEGVRKFSDKRIKHTKDQIEAVQREIGIKEGDVDGVFGPETLKKMDEYLNNFDASLKKTTASKKKVESSKKSIDNVQKKLEAQTKNLDAVNEKLLGIDQQLSELMDINKRMLSIYTRKKKFSDVSGMYFDQIDKIDDILADTSKKLSKKDRKLVLEQKDYLEKKILENNIRYEKVKAIVDPELIALQRKKEALFASYPGDKDIKGTDDYLAAINKDQAALNKKKASIEKQIAKSEAQMKNSQIARSIDAKANEAVNSQLKTDDQLVSEFLQYYRRTSTDTDRDLFTNVELEDVAKSYLGLSTLELNAKRADLVAKFDETTGSSSGDRRYRDFQQAQILLVDDLIARKSSKGEANAKPAKASKTENISIENKNDLAQLSDANLAKRSEILGQKLNEKGLSKVDKDRLSKAHKETIDEIVARGDKRIAEINSSNSTLSQDIVLTTTQKEKVIDDFIDNRQNTTLKNDKELYGESQMRTFAETYMDLSSTELLAKQKKLIEKFDNIPDIQASAQRRERDMVRSQLMLVNDLLALKQGKTIDATPASLISNPSKKQLEANLPAQLLDEGKLPTSAKAAMGYVERVGVWLGKKAVGPAWTSAKQSLTRILKQFPNSKKLKLKANKLLDRINQKIGSIEVNPDFKDFPMLRQYTSAKNLDFISTKVEAEKVMDDVLKEIDVEIHNASPSIAKQLLKSLSKIFKNLITRFGDLGSKRAKKFASAKKALKARSKMTQMHYAAELDIKTSFNQNLLELKDGWVGVLGGATAHRYVSFQKKSSAIHDKLDKDLLKYEAKYGKSEQLTNLKRDFDDLVEQIRDFKGRRKEKIDVSNKSNEISLNKE